MTRRPHAILADITDNAMLYKDITQWLRNRTFLFLFFGLLAVAEIIIAFVVLAPPDEESVGAISFGFLAGVLSVYAVIIAFLGHNLTAREFFHQTFELYELSGMSLEKMVWGKLLSMLTQFFFGFFCVVPFMFVSFTLGGLDFYRVLATAILTAIAVLPMYLLALFLALLSKSKQLSGVLRVGALIFVFILIPYFGGFFYFEMVGMRGGTGLVDFFKLLLMLDQDALATASIFLMFYTQICLLLFYACCNAISPSTDSRATAIHFLVFLLTLSYLGLMWFDVVNKLYVSDSTGYVYYIPLMIPYLIMGLGSFYNRLDVPVMAAKRRRAARFPLTRLVYALFHPGAKGACQTLVLIYALFPLSWVVVSKVGMNVPMEFHEAAGLAMQLPFFLAFPGILLVLNRNTGRNIAGVRTAVLAWWVILGFPLMIMVLMSDFQRRSVITLGGVAIQGFAILLSPLSAIFVQGEGWLLMRVVLGVAGLIALGYMVRIRRERESVIDVKPEIA